MELNGYGSAFNKINEVRASVGYKPMVGVAPSPCEMDKNVIRVQSLGSVYKSLANKNNAFSVLAMLRITD